MVQLIIYLQYVLLFLLLLYVILFCEFFFPLSAVCSLKQSSYFFIRFRLVGLFIVNCGRIGQASNDDTRSGFAKPDWTIYQKKRKNEALNRSNFFSYPYLVSKGIPILSNGSLIDLLYMFLCIATIPKLNNMRKQLIKWCHSHLTQSICFFLDISFPTILGE